MAASILARSIRQPLAACLDQRVICHPSPQRARRAFVRRKRVEGETAAHEEGDAADAAACKEKVRKVAYRAEIALTCAA